MSKLMLALFGSLTLGAMALTMTDTGVMAPALEKLDAGQRPSSSGLRRNWWGVRQDSAHSGIKGVGRYRSGK